MASSDIPSVRRVSRITLLPETRLTRGAIRVSLAVMLATSVFLLWRYSSLPDLLPVHFRPSGTPNGWQYRTLPRVFMPVIVQLGLLGVFGAISALLLSRDEPEPDVEAPDAGAARTASEAIMLMAAIWIAFQGYAAFSLVALWTGGGSTLGTGYTVLEVIGLALTVVVGARAMRGLGRPVPLPYDPAHWRLRQLYCNAQNPALFVPTRDGRRWTLNFGRPAAALLLGGVLAIGIVAPSMMLTLALR